jgi:hypothetical protein
MTNRKYKTVLARASMDSKSDDRHTAATRGEVWIQETTHRPPCASNDFRLILPSPNTSRNEASSAIRPNHLKSRRSHGRAKATQRDEVQRTLHESRVARPLLPARRVKEDGNVARIVAQESSNQRTGSAMRESITPRPLLPMPIATVGGEKPGSKSQVGRPAGPGDSHVSSRMTIQRVMRESRRSRPLPPMAGQFRFVDVRMSDLAQGREKKSGWQGERDHTDASRQSSGHQTQPKGGRNGPGSLPTRSVSAREEETGSRELEFVFWEGPEERQNGISDCEGEGSNLQTKANLRKESSQRRLRGSAGSSTLSHGRFPPAANHGREIVWSITQETGARWCAIERNPFVPTHTGSEGPGRRGRGKKPTDLPNRIGIGRHEISTQMPLATSLGGAASLGPSLAPRGSYGVQEIMFNAPEQIQRTAELNGSQAGSRSRKRKHRSQESSQPLKRPRSGGRRERTKTDQSDDLKDVLQWLENEYENKSKLSSTRGWCKPIPLDRKVETVQKFYSAMHNSKTLPIQTCSVCYRKCAEEDLEIVSSIDWKSLVVDGSRSPMPLCVICYPNADSVTSCKSCARLLERGMLSPAAQLHTRLGCEHIYPDDLKGLTPVEEKLISLNSCYGFITKHSIESGHRQDMRYPRHVKGHILVFPNNVEELTTKVLPHPLVQLMENIHVSWHGRERPEPTDLSRLLSVRRGKVEAALRWLKKNNRHYRDITIDVAEMNSWTSFSGEVPHMIYERMERNEPSAREKIQTAQVVPPTERGTDMEEHEGNIEEVIAQLRSAEDAPEFSDLSQGIHGECQEGCHAEHDEQAESGRGDTLFEVNAAGMFGLDGAPDIPEAEKFRYFCSTVRKDTEDATNSQSAPDSRVKGSVGVKRARMQKQEPYIHISRGDEFADGLDTWFFAKAFPTLFPYGFGGPRLAEEAMVGSMGKTGPRKGVDRTAPVATVSGLIGSRNMSLRAWTEIVLRRHGGRFANHHVFPFLAFNLGLRSRNRRISMLSMNRKNFSQLERLVGDLTATRLEAAQKELQQSNNTSDKAVQELLRSISVYGHRQPMSREQRLSLRRKIKSLIIRYGMPAIWFTLNPNDITNPIKLRLASYRTRDAKDAEEFLRSLDVAYKRARLAVSDPMSSAIFFHREISLFFEHYVKVGEESVFGRISQYFGAVETNERGALHLHGLLWLEGNLHFGSLLHKLGRNKEEEYGEDIALFADSIFSEV